MGMFWRCFFILFLFLFLFLSLCVFIVLISTFENFFYSMFERLYSSCDMIIGWHELIGFNFFFISLERVFTIFSFILGFVESCDVLLHSEVFDDIGGWFTLFLLDFLDLIIALQFYFYLWENFNFIKFFITLLYRKLKISLTWVSFLFFVKLIYDLLQLCSSHQIFVFWKQFFELSHWSRVKLLAIKLVCKELLIRTWDILIFDIFSMLFLSHICSVAVEDRLVLYSSCGADFTLVEIVVGFVQASHWLLYLSNK